MPNQFGQWYEISYPYKGYGHIQMQGYVRKEDGLWRFYNGRATSYTVTEAQAKRKDFKRVSNTPVPAWKQKELNASVKRWCNIDTPDNTPKEQPARNFCPRCKVERCPDGCCCAC